MLILGVVTQTLDRFPLDWRPAAVRREPDAYAAVARTNGKSDSNAAAQRCRCGIRGDRGGAGPVADRLVAELRQRRPNTGAPVGRLRRSPRRYRTLSNGAGRRSVAVGRDRQIPSVSTGSCSRCRPWRNNASSRSCNGSASCRRRSAWLRNTSRRCQIASSISRPTAYRSARTFVPDSWSAPLSFYEVNLLGTVNVLEFCRARGASLTLVSSYVYGPPARLPIAEDEPLCAFNPYSHTKILAEETSLYYQRQFGVPVTIVRPFNVYGPGQDADF